jgi:hypothetical protein
MKKLICLLLVVLCFSIITQAKTTTKKTTILFNTAKHNLTKHAVKELKEFLINNLTNLDYEITIEGHTDSRGNLAYNKKLSFDRATEVKQFLIKNGIDEKVISFDYRGELDPEKPNSNDKNMEVNRRVEVTLTTYNFENIAELEEALSPNKTSNHIIKPGKETVIKGKKGVKILLQANTFIYEDGTPINEDVKFELTESLSYKDFISSGLLTKSADELLESGGMIKVAATTVKGKPVKIADGKEMLIAIPNNNRQDNMEVFTSNEGDDWTTTNQPITKIVKFNSNNSFPVMSNNNISLPKFKYSTKNKPKAPNPPNMSRIPFEPRQESYIRHIPWYKFGKEKRRIKQKEAYAKAIERYHKRLERYEKNQASYKKKSIAYNKALDEYHIALDCWNDDRSLALVMFKRTPAYRKAVKRYNANYQYNLEQYKQEVKLWRQKRKNEATEKGIEMDKMGMTNAESLNSYVFAFNQLSWINVDRFYHMEEKDKQIIVMKTDEIKDERVMILFKNIGSMLRMYPDKITNEYRQSGFPKKEEAVIFAYKVEEGKPMICYREIDGSDKYHLDYMETTFAEIKAILNQFEGPKKS